MNLRRQYIVVGIAWALLVGPLAAFMFAGLAAGASWLWLFGDDAWPSATQWILPLIGLVGGLLGVAACLSLALLVGRSRAAAATDEQRERWRVLVLTALPIALMGMLVGKLWWDTGQRSREAILSDQRESAFAELLAARHQIAGLTVERINDGRFNAVVRLTGQREGAYQVRWQVSETSLGTPLISDEQLIELAAGSYDVELGFSDEQLKNSYRSKVLDGAGTVLVEEPFRLDVSVAPILTVGELQALPPEEQSRLAGDTPLISTDTAEFPVRFTVRSPGPADL